jgi:protoporphyrinogen oxidase
VSYSPGIDIEFDVWDVVRYLRGRVSKETRYEMTFKQFALQELGKVDYNKFLLYVGETDFEEEDVMDVLYGYGFEFMTNGMEGFSIDWKGLLKAFRRELKKKKRCTFRLNTEVREIKRRGKYYLVNGGGEEEEEYDKVIIATAISTVKMLLGPWGLEREYDNIACQSFVRLYVRFNIPLNIKTRLVITRQPFQKIIAIDPDPKACIYMISYCDNKMANKWERTDREKYKDIVEKGIRQLFDGQEVIVEDEKIIYWECGTHYFKPLLRGYRDRDEYLAKVQHPMENVYVVGEAFSHEQGWCEGALQSVHNISGLHDRK